MSFTSCLQNRTVNTCYHSDSDVPADLKEEIFAFINEGGIIEDGTKITAWRELFKEAANEFHVDYHNFLALVIAHSHNMEYWLHGTGGKFVVLEPGYITRWYLTHLFNTHTVHSFDYSSLLIIVLVVTISHSKI